MLTTYLSCLSAWALPNHLLSGRRLQFRRDPGQVSLKSMHISMHLVLQDCFTVTVDYCL